MLQLAAIWPRGHNTFFSGSTQLRMKLFLLTDLKLLTTANSFLLNYAEHEMFIVNKYENAMKISIVGIFIFISRKKKNNSAEHETCPANKSQITNNCEFFLAKLS